jgi:hypothetical protein
MGAAWASALGGEASTIADAGDDGDDAALTGDDAAAELDGAGCFFWSSQPASGGTKRTRSPRAHRIRPMALRLARTTAARWAVASGVGAGLAFVFAVRERPAWASSPEAPSVVAQVQCDKATEPGRVRCGVDVRPTDRQKLVWADVSVVRAPSFSSALRGRVGPGEATARDATGYRFALALVARINGKGPLVLRVRAVTCSDGDGCRASSVEVSTELSVGP